MKRTHNALMEEKTNRPRVKTILGVMKRAVRLTVKINFPRMVCHGMNMRGKLLRKIVNNLLPRSPI